MTEGFHPTPRLVFAQSLPLGVIGHAEVAELELTEESRAGRGPDSAPGPGPAGNRVPDRANRIPVQDNCPAAAGRLLASRLDDPPGRTREPDAPTFLAATEVWADRERPTPATDQHPPSTSTRLTVSSDGVLGSASGSPRTARPGRTKLAKAVGLTDTTRDRTSGIGTGGRSLARGGGPDAEDRAADAAAEPSDFGRPRPDRPRETWGATANGPIVE